MTDTTPVSQNTPVQNSPTPNEELMTKARALLKGKWGLCVGVTFIYMLITGAPSSITKGGQLVAFILSGPMTFGLCSFFLLLIRGNNSQLSNLFDGFNRFVQCFLLYLLMVVFIVLWALLLIVPGIIAALSYAMAYYILVDDQQIGVMDALRKSKQMMNGYKWKLFCLGFRFLGWALLCILTVGIGFLWLLPYMQTSVALFYEDIRGANIANVSV